MKLALYQDGAAARVGVVAGDEITPTRFTGSMIDLISGWGAAAPELKAASQSGKRAPLSTVRLLAPVQRPGKIFAIGLNYADHIAETGMEAPKNQVWFTKAVTSVNGPH